MGALAAAYAFALPLLIGMAVALPESVIWRGLMSGPGSRDRLFYDRTTQLLHRLLLFALASLPIVRRRSPPLAFRFPASYALGFAVLCIVATFGTNDRLPDLVARDRFSSMHTLLCAVSMLFALVCGRHIRAASQRFDHRVLGGGRRSSCRSRGMVAALINTRYSLGWYRIRGFSMVAYTAVLGALPHAGEPSHARAARAVVGRRRAADAC